MKKEERLKGINPMIIPGIGKRMPVHQIKYVFEEVAKYFDMRHEDMRSKSRKREIVTARHIFYFMAKKYTKATFAYIGEYSSDDNWKAQHSNVYLMRNKIEKEIGYNDHTTQYVEDLTVIFEQNKYG
jgi:chromosomal replication initiator protein